VPSIALRYMRASFFFLIYGILIGLHISAAMHFGRGGYGATYVSAHTHVQMIGFFLMGIAGVALWKLPEPAPGTRANLPELCWWGLVAAVLARSTCEVLETYVTWRWLGPATFTASCFEGLLVFVLGRHLLARARALQRTK